MEWNGTERNGTKWIEMKQIENERKKLVQLNNQETIVPNVTVLIHFFTFGK
jgi:hypothetical protein